MPEYRYNIIRLNRKTLRLEAKQMNHSDKFYADVLRLYPDYEQCNKWLKDNGAAIMERNI